jgi:hypothetical protein
VTVTETQPEPIYNLHDWQSGQFLSTATEPQVDAGVAADGPFWIDGGGNPVADDAQLNGLPSPVRRVELRPEGE